MTTITPAALLGLRERQNAGVYVPFRKNRNDKSTLFAGSLFSGAVLAGYRLAQQHMKARGIAGTLVARDAAVRYLRPVTTGATARPRLAGGFRAAAHGNLHLRVVVDVVDARQAVCCTCRCTYVVMSAKRNRRR